MTSANGIKSAFLIQAINALIMGVVFIVLPLLMMERGISIESMGLIFAALPLVTQSTRLLFGIVSDYMGRKRFYWLNAFMNMSFLAIYYLAITPLGFLFGKICEGIRSASLWSVNRAYFIDHSKEKEEEMLVKMRGVNSVFEALGTIIAGFLVAMILYEKVLLFLIILSLLIFPNVKMLKDKFRGKIKPMIIFKALDFRHKGKKFKNFILIFFLIGLSWGLISGYILPLFLKTRGVTIGNIGVLLGVWTFLNGIFAYIFHSIWSGKKKILVGGILSSISISVLSFCDPVLLPLLIFCLGVANGIANAGYETIFVSVADYNSLGRDIGILMIGTHLGMSITQALSGFVITSLGFSILFIMSAVLYLLFSVTAFYNMNGQEI